MTHDEILALLKEDSPHRLSVLWALADRVRAENVGDEVHLRGLIELSNHCARSCGYCGLRGPNVGLARYRMSADEVLACARCAHALGFGTVVLQSGEDWGISTEWMADVIRRIKAEMPLAVTLSLGERTDVELQTWREAGADRYLLRFETSDRRLYDCIHPPLTGRPSDRIALLGRLREIGYETGSGVMVGIPGQSFESLADDIELFHTLDLDMIGLGPYIPHPDTPLAPQAEAAALHDGWQVPRTEEMTHRALALARLVCPQANIPSTTALATLNREEGYELGLRRGANVVMPNVTPTRYRQLYEVYPGKAGALDDDEAHAGDIRRRILAIGRRVGTGRGDAPRRAERVERRPSS